ncbi:MAG: hypothetical protein KAU24_01025, partial [Candidatus Aenigmarchaeota archaeon]|nr:hypothetical protein [Candidatus Aenigmarchaeota archaeon]
LQIPNGTEYLNGTNVTIRVNITDDCTDMQSNIYVTFEMINESGYTYSCTPVQNESGGDAGWYNCTFNTSTMTTRSYTTMVNSSKTDYNFNSTKYSYTPNVQSFWIETMPWLNESSINITPMVGGWSEMFNFTINVTDWDLDYVTVEAFYRKDSDAWSSLGTNNESGINWQAFFTKSYFGVSYIDENVSIIFNATEDDQWYYETSIVNITVERDDVNFTYKNGSDVSVNRVGSDSVHMMLYVYDEDDYTTPHAPVTGTSGPGKFWVTINGSSYAWDNGSSQINTNGSGYLIYDFDPTCDHEVGTQYWKGGIIEGSNFYKPANSTVKYNNLTINITSEFQPIIYPQENPPHNNTFLYQTDTVPLLGLLNDSGNCGGVTGANVTFIVVGTGYDYTAEGNGTGWYNATIDDTGLPSYAAGNWYNVTMNATKNFYTDNQTTHNYTFFLATRPVLSLGSPPVSPTFGGWGQTFTFKVRAYDEDGTNLTVYLWKRPPGASEWELLRSKPCAPCSTQPGSPTELTFTIDNFTCADVNSSIQYKFNATDDYQYNSTSEPGGTFDILRDVVSYVEYYGDGDNAIREGDGTTLLTVLVQDTYNGSNPIPGGYNGSIYVTTNGQDWGPVYTNQTNASGFLNWYFDANCTHDFGQQKWKAIIENDDCYVEQGWQFNNTLNVIGQLKNNIDIPAQGSTFNITQNITIRLNVTSDCSAEGRINQTNVYIELRSPYGNWTDCTPILNESGSNSGYYNCTWDSTGYREGNWSIQLNSTRTYFNANQTFLQYWFQLLNWNATNQSIQLTPQQDGWTKRYNYTVMIDDPENETINCTLWIYKDDGNGWINKGTDTLPTGDGTCSVIVWDFTGDDIGNNWFKFMIVNTEPENTYNTTNGTGPTLEPSNVTINFISANNTEVNITNDYELLIARINDTDNYTDGVSWHPPNVNVTFWLNYNSSSIDPGNLTYTNSTGYANISFNPTCEYSVGLHQWFAGSTDDYYQKLNTSENLTITIKDDLNVGVESPLGEEYLRGVNITIQFNVTDNCNNNITAITDFNITMVSQLTSQEFYCDGIQEIGNGTYNCSFNTSGMPARGYILMITANETYYNPDNLTLIYSDTQNKSFFIETEPILSNPMVNSSVDGGNSGSWSETWNFTVNVTDDDGDSVSITLYKRKWTDGTGWGPWQEVGPTSCDSNCNNTLVWVIEQGYPDDPTQYDPQFDLGTWSFKFNATD